MQRRVPSSEGFVVNVYGDQFENGETVQTYHVTTKDTTKHLIQQVLRRNHLNLKDPNLFYLTFQLDQYNMLTNYEPMTTQQYTAFPSNDPTARTPTGILYSNAVLARTLDLRKDNRLTIRTHPGKLIRIYDNCFSKPPSIRQLYVSRTTCAEEVVELVLNLVGSTDPPSEYCLVEEDTNDKRRILRDKDYPLLITQINGPNGVLILQRRQDVIRAEKTRKKPWQFGKSKPSAVRPDSPEVTNYAESENNHNTCGRLNPFPMLFKGLNRGKAVEAQPCYNGINMATTRSHSYTNATTRSQFEGPVNHNDRWPGKCESASNIPHNVTYFNSPHRSGDFRPPQGKTRSAPIEVDRTGSNWSLAPSGFLHTPESKSYNTTPCQTMERPMNIPWKYNDVYDAFQVPQFQRKASPYASPAYFPLQNEIRLSTMPRSFTNYECEQRPIKSHPNIAVHHQPTIFRAPLNSSWHNAPRSSKSAERFPPNRAVSPRTELEQIWARKQTRQPYSSPPEPRPRLSSNQPLAYQKPIPARRHLYNTADDNEFYFTSTTKRTTSPTPVARANLDAQKRRAQSMPLNEQTMKNINWDHSEHTDRTLTGNSSSAGNLNNKLEPRTRSTKTAYIPGRFMGVNSILQDATNKKESSHISRKSDHSVRSEAPKDVESVPQDRTGFIQMNQHYGPRANEQRPKSKWNTVLKELNAENTPQEDMNTKEVEPIPIKATEKKLTLHRNSPKIISGPPINLYKMTVNVPMKRTIENIQPTPSKATTQQNSERSERENSSNVTTASFHFSPQRPSNGTSLSKQSAADETAADATTDNVFSCMQPSTYPSLFDILHHCNVIRIVLDPNIPCTNDQLGLILGLSKFPLDDIQRANNLQRLKDNEFKGFIQNGVADLKRNFNGSSTVGSSSMNMSPGKAYLSVDEAPDVVTVEAVIPNTPASIEGSLSAGMLLLEVNGEPLIQTAKRIPQNLLRLAQQRLRSSFYAAKHGRAPMIKLTAAKYHNKFGPENKVTNLRNSGQKNIVMKNPRTQWNEPLPSILNNNSLSSARTSIRTSQHLFNTRSTWTLSDVIQNSNGADIDSRSETTTEASTNRNSDVCSLKDKLQWFPTWNSASHQPKWPNG